MTKWRVGRTGVVAVACCHEVFDLDNVGSWVVCGVLLDGHLLVEEEELRKVKEVNVGCKVRVKGGHMVKEEGGCKVMVGEDRKVREVEARMARVDVHRVMAEAHKVRVEDGRMGKVEGVHHMAKVDVRKARVVSHKVIKDAHHKVKAEVVEVATELARAMGTLGASATSEEPTITKS